MTEKNKEYKEWLAQVFDRGSDRYGQVGPQFFSYFGEKVAERAGLVEGSSVLDIACGRGAVLMPAYERVGPAGKMIGIDLSLEMVAETQKEVESRGLDAIQIIQMDAEDQQFPDKTFNFVLCGFALFFFPNVEQALAEIRRVLKPGGIFCTTTFGEDDSRWDAFDEVIMSYKDKLRPVPQSDGLSFDKPDEILAKLTKAGFNEIEITSENREFYYANADEWWVTLWSHGMRALLERLDEGTLEEFRRDCYKMVQRLAGEKGIPQLFSVLITKASRPVEIDSKDTENGDG